MVTTTKIFATVALATSVFATPVVQARDSVAEVIADGDAPIVIERRDAFSDFANEVAQLGDHVNKLWGDVLTLNQQGAEDEFKQIVNSLSSYTEKLTEAAKAYQPPKDSSTSSQLQKRWSTNWIIATIQSFSGIIFDLLKAGPLPYIQVAISELHKFADNLGNLILALADKITGYSTISSILSNCIAGIDSALAGK